MNREHVESLLIALHEAGRAPATVSNRFRALQQFFAYLDEGGEVSESPMHRMSLPQVPERLVHVLGEDELRAFLATCRGAVRGAPPTSRTPEMPSSTREAPRPWLASRT